MDGAFEGRSSGFIVRTLAGGKFCAAISYHVTCFDSMDLTTGANTLVRLAILAETVVLGRLVVRHGGWIGVLRLA